MTILFLSHTDSNLYNFRLPVMKQLVDNGHRVIALIPHGDCFFKFQKHGIDAISYNINRASLNPLSAIKTILEIAKILKTQQPDIIHTFMLKPNIYGSFAAKIAKLDCVINSLTGLGSFYIENTTKTVLVRFIIETLNKISFKIARTILFQNNDDLQLYVNKGIVKKEKTVLIKGSGINTNIFTPLSMDEKIYIRKKLDIPQDSCVILMVARAIKHKGVIEYYEAAKNISNNVNNVLFLYVGGTDNGNMSPISEEYLKQGSVRYLGVRDDIRDIIGICDIFVLPSYREGIPRTLLEAGSMAKAIITTNAIGCREVVDDEQNGLLVNIADSNDLEAKIVRLIQDKELRDRFGQKSREKIKKEFGVESIVDSYLKLYNNTIIHKTKTKSTIYQSTIKPLLDKFMALILLVLFLPIIAIVAFLIKTKLGSPILFTQDRPGKNGKIFKIYKFRTMSDEKDNNGNLLPDEDRLKGFGKIIRKTSLDELPQLFNVLKGEMSFIGPRPLLVEYLELYSKEQARRHEVLPGITGWAQVNGRNAISWEEKFKLDVYYVNNISFILDCKIFVLTIYKVIKRKDISSSTSVTMEKFSGNKN